MMSASALALVAALALAQEENPAPERPNEDELFGGSQKPPDPTRPAEATPADPGWEDLDAPRPTPGLGDLVGFEDDPLAIGGTLYLRMMGSFTEGGVRDQRLQMPNLLDLYLDGRPDPHVRGFVSGRLRYDPSIAEGSVNAFGQEQSPFDILLDQLWIKTDLANAVYLTVGQQRLKWGTGRIWNPADFVNARRLDPLALFDERTGVPAIKVHVPIESLGWNFYGLLLVRDVTTFKDLAGGGRAEIVLGPTEWSVSVLGGKGYRTSIGVDFSAGLWDFDVHGEIAWTDETGQPHWVGDFSFDPLELPTQRTRNNWYTRINAGIEYAFKPSDDDLMLVGVEYFYNSLGTTNPDLYPWLLAQGALQPFYVGQHYLAAYWAYPGPGNWDEGSLGMATLGNLSDLTFATRINLAWEVHRRLSFEIFAMFHYGKPGGEFRFELDTPEIPAIPGVTEEAIPAIHVPRPILELGLNLKATL
jgi:hypothetical protein